MSHGMSAHCRFAGRHKRAMFTRKATRHSTLKTLVGEKLNIVARLSVHGKIGQYHHLEERGAPEQIRREVMPVDEQLLRDLTARYFPAAAGPLMTLKSCMFTNAPDGHFLIDLHPDYPQVSYASACSGHGFKFGSVIGEILADLTLNGATPLPIAPFSWAALETRSSRGAS